MEIWELAAALGANRPDGNADLLADDAGFTFMQRRAIAAARGEELPTFDDVPLSPKEEADLLRLAQGAQVLMPPTDVEG